MSKPNWADETIVGRIRVDGGWDRRFRYRPPAEPKSEGILAPLLVVGLWAVAFWIYFAVAAAAVPS